MDWKKVLGTSMLVVAAYWLDRAFDSLELHEEDPRNDPRDVTPPGKRTKPHKKDYSSGDGLFGKHKGVYDWGKD
jgi:hypothetical protein